MYSDLGVVEMVSANDSGSGIGAAGTRREDVLPTPIDCGLGIFAGESGGHVDAAETIGQIINVRITKASPLTLFAQPVSP